MSHIVEVKWSFGTEPSAAIVRSFADAVHEVAEGTIVNSGPFEKTLYYHARAGREETNLRKRVCMLLGKGPSYARKM